MRRATILTLFLLLITCLVAAEGYVVILKNGHKIRCKEPLQIEGEQALLTLATGTVASYPLEQIDLVETERYNKLGLGDAILIEELTVGGTPAPTPTPKLSLGHFATIDAENREAELGANVTPTPTPTPGIKLQSEGYHDQRVVEAFSNIFDKKNLYLYRTSAGTRPDALYVQAVTDSQREVFTALKVVAEAYMIIHQLHPDMAPSAVELQMVQTSGKTAGTFRLTPELAKRVANQETTPEKFYVEHVIF